MARDPPVTMSNPRENLATRRLFVTDRRPTSHFKIPRDPRPPARPRPPLAIAPQEANRWLAGSCRWY
jgi:hypothetical protein